MPDALQDDVVAVAVTASDVVYDGAIWNVRRNSFDYNGSNITREYIEHPGAVAVLALDEHDRVLLIKQYRHPTGLRGWELPAGLLDVTGENAVVGAQRELAEEADVVASEWALLTEFYTSPGGSNEAIRVYLARDVSAVAAFDRTEEEADIELRWVPLDECVDAVLARRISNPILIVAVLAAQVARSRGWSTLAPADLPWPRHPLSLHSRTSTA
ncbi:NUDIX hydrolase [Cryobacterium sp. TMT1-3]|uniref:NUDIX hydrolase n=1 Tax=Cryobacterium luteum TaxID=1424661 RepID=A0A1H8JPG8_9MICO|nr:MULTISPECIES: NUDIX hydrolase [Cryobacterium]TFB83887.1 NUDIX hydrolase [Cryobacterium luteum]TFC31946.1 NUDIX hydrolase [Cryobacterium sp. TMT1-3]SEN82582.1 ADP-ribose pyrophosphatase [Cryobacterium luteum]